MNSTAYAVRSANGSRRKRAVGIVRPPAHRNFISAAAERVGILSTHAENVRAASINGVGQAVWRVTAIRFTKIGIYEIFIKSRIIQLVFSPKIS